MTITESSGGIGFDEPTVGTFLLNLNRRLNLAACVAVATPIANENFDLRVSTTWREEPGSPDDTVVVRLWEVTPLNQPTDDDFNLSVLC